MSSHPVVVAQSKRSRRSGRPRKNSVGLWAVAALLLLVTALVYLGLGARRMEALCTTDGFQADHFRAETVGESVRHGFSLAPPGFTCSRGGESTVMLIPRD